MISGDEENPDLQQIPSEMPSEDYPEPEPPREFLNSESPESVLPGEELPSPDGILGDGTSNPLPEQDPDASLEEILASESFPEGVEVLPEPEPVPLPQVPTFQIRLGPISGEAKPLLKKFLEAQTISLSEKVWASPSPVISQLTEFQAIALYQNARALGIFAEAQIVLPHSPIPSEDDLALGDLSAIPDPIPVETHSAPSVNLPRGERDVILCTMDTLPGLSLIENFGIVAAHRTIPRRLFREDDLDRKSTRLNSSHT